MKKSILFIILSIVSFCAEAQTMLKGTIANFVDVRQVKVEYSENGYFLKDKALSLDKLEEAGKFSFSIPMQKNGLVILWLIRDNGAQKVFQIYIKPNTTLEISTDFQDFDKTLVFKGEMAKENEYFYKNMLENPASSSSKIYAAHFPQDSLPAQCKAHLREKEKKSLQSLLDYHKQHKLDKDFVAFMKVDIAYYYKWVFISMANIHYIEQYRANSSKIFENHNWRKWATKEMQFVFDTPQENALKCYWNMWLCSPQKNLMWVCIHEDPLEFMYIQFEHFEAYTLNAEEKINKVYKGNALALFYANYIHQLCQMKPNFVPKMYERFKQKLPNSAFLPALEVKINDIITFHEAQDKEVQVIEKYQDIHTLNDLLKPFAGKVVLIDLWGSWCGACKQEFAFSKDLKKQFEGKDVVFLYVANETTHEKVREEFWLKNIRGYHLVGHHLIGNKPLFNDIWQQVATISEAEIKQISLPHEQEIATNIKNGKGEFRSFPTYLIADRTGKIAVKFAYKPRTKTLLYKQIEDVLNQQ